MPTCPIHLSSSACRSACSQLHPLVCTQVNASPPMSTRPTHLTSSTHRPMRPHPRQSVGTWLTRPQPRQRVRMQANPSPVTPARPHSGKHVPGHVSKSASRQNASLATPARLHASKHAPGHVSTSPSALHYEYFSSVSFLSLTIYFPAHLHCPLCNYIYSSCRYSCNSVRHHNILFLCSSYW